MERRRIKMRIENAELITNGLQFWFDGKNNMQGGGFNQSATTWYPYMKNNSIPDNYYLSKYGSGSWNSNGGYTFTSSDGRFENQSYSPLYYLSDVYDFTFVVCLENYSSQRADLVPVASTFSADPGTHRWRLTLSQNRLGFVIFDNQWLEYYGSVHVKQPIKTIAYVRNGSVMSVYMNGILSSRFNVTSIYLGNVANVTFCLGSYGGEGSINNVPYYSCQMYNRALTSDEVSRCHAFITHRYGL